MTNEELVTKIEKAIKEYKSDVVNVDNIRIISDGDFISLEYKGFCTTDTFTNIRNIYDKNNKNNDIPIEDAINKDLMIVLRNLESYIKEYRINQK